MAATHTVIVGSGIIGVSAAYYLSLLTLQKEDSDGGPKREHFIHLVDPSPVLFERVASGRAAGFLARNWFSSSAAELGAFSFDLHKQLAEQFDGRKNWGWSQSTVIDLDITGNRKKDGGKGLGEGWDWIMSGESRVASAGSAEDEYEELTECPPWLNEFPGARPLTDHKFTAQMWAVSVPAGRLHMLTICRSNSDPLRLCNFLLDKCRSRNTVLVHNPALVTELVKPASDSESPVVIIEYQNTPKKVTVPCDNLIVTSGLWTPSVLNSLLPEEPPASFPAIGSLSGAWIIIRSKRWQPLETDTSQVNALFLSKLEGFTPEIFSRVGGEIYVAGINDASIPPPPPMTPRLPPSDSVDRLISVAELLCSSGSTKACEGGTDFEVVSRGLCFRPTTQKGTPVIGQISLENGGSYGKKFRLWIGSGHGPWGICMSLGTGMVLSQMVLGMETSVDVSELYP